MLVLEKDRFPRFRIGESLLPMANGLMRASGVWPKVEAAGFFPKYGAAFYTGDGAAAQKLDFRRSVVPGLELTYQVERARFDALLLDHARELGAEVRMQSRVEAVRETAEGMALRVSGGGGAEYEAHARWVFDGGGRLNAMSTGFKRELDPSPFPRRVAVFSHFHGVVRAAGRAEGDTVVVRLRDGWFWLIPLDREKTSVGLVITAEALKRAGGTPEEVFRRTVEHAPKLKELMGRAEATMPFQTVSDYSYFHRSLAQGRFLRIGDAAGFFDPIFSSGVYMSMTSAQAAVAAALQADRAGRGLTAREAARYTREVKAHAGTFQRLIGAFYDNPSFEVFMSPEIPFDIEPGITAIVAGHAKLTFPLWWRFNLFLLACRRHRIRPIAPKLNFEAFGIV